MRFFLISQGSLNPKIRFLGQKVCSVARLRTDRQTDTEVKTEDTLSGFQVCFLQPIIKDRSKNNTCTLLYSGWNASSKNNVDTCTCTFFLSFISKEGVIFWSSLAYNFKKLRRHLYQPFKLLTGVLCSWTTGWVPSLGRPDKPDKDSRSRIKLFPYQAEYCKQTAWKDYCTEASVGAGGKRGYQHN